MVGEAKPSLLEILHSKTVSPLCPLYHESEQNERRTIEKAERCVHVAQKMFDIFRSLVQCYNSAVWCKLLYIKLLIITV